MIRLSVLLLVAVTAASALGATPAEVEKALDKAKQFLYSQQKGGNWEVSALRQGINPPDVAGVQWGGLTAISTYALLAAGESPQDPRMKQAINFLMDADLIGNYATALRAQVWLLLPEPRDPKEKAILQKCIYRDAVALQAEGPRGSKSFNGLYQYYNGFPGGDKSNSQYGVLGVWACAQTGLEVPRDYWEMVDKVWRKDQNPDGSWSYGGPGQSLGAASDVNLTAAGVATMFIMQDMLYGSQGVKCEEFKSNESIDKGLNWMSKNIKLVSMMYGWYGVERIGVASGYKYFGTTDWYKEGSDLMVKTQTPAGAWNYAFGIDGAKGTIPGTAWGILFLVRGRAPVVMNKLQYDLDLHGEVKHEVWTQRPRDAANVVKWIGQQLERDLNWQIVNLNVPIEDLHDAPILYISGNRALTFKKPEIDKLRQFVEGGGMILGNANCKSKEFPKAFRELGSDLFPAYEFREVPAESPIYRNEQFVRDKNWKFTKLEGLSNGARELMLLFPDADPAQFWQTQSIGGHEELHRLMANIFLYAVDKKNLRYKGETYIVQPDPKITAQRTVKVARLEFAGNWDPEPGGWRRLGAILHNTRKLDLAVQNLKLGEGKLTKEFAVAHLTGTGSFKLTDPQAKELKDYVTAGGTLIVDAAAGDGAFGQAAETELARVFEKDLRKTLKPDHDAVTGGDSKFECTYRDAARQRLGRMNVHRIRGIEMGDRVAVFYSEEDLSVGMVGMPIDGIYGYSPSTATNIMANLVWYGANGGKLPTSQPATTRSATAPGTGK